MKLTLKSYVKPHTRVDPSGKVVQISAYTDKRTKKPVAAATEPLSLQALSEKIQALHRQAKSPRASIRMQDTLVRAARTHIQQAIHASVQRGELTVDQGNAYRDRLNMIADTWLNGRTLEEPSASTKDADSGNDSGKQPWELNADEYLDGTRFYRSGKTKNAEVPGGERVILSTEATAKNFRETNGKFLIDVVRRNAVAAAANQGLPVPSHVQADYPDLPFKQQGTSKEYAYRISRRAVNSVRVLPPVGKQFDEQTLAEMKAKLKEAGATVIQQGSGLAVIDDDVWSLVESTLPMKQTKATTLSLQKKEAFEERENKRKSDNQSYLASSPSVPWIESVFGKDFENQHNRTALARFLDGAEKKFEGMASWKWQDGIEKVGAYTEDKKGIDWKKLKDAYEQSTAPISPVLRSPTSMTKPELDAEIKDLYSKFDQSPDEDIREPIRNRIDSLVGEKIERRKKEPISSADVTDGIISAIHSFADAEHRWKPLQEHGATNQQIQDQIRYELGADGGQAGPGRLNLRYRGGASPIVTIGSGRGDAVEIKGAALVSAVRAAMNIPQPEPSPGEQLSLFKGLTLTFKNMGRQVKTFVLNGLAKAHVKAYTRTGKDGKVVQVKDHEDKRAAARARFKKPRAKASLVLPSQKRSAAAGKESDPSASPQPTSQGEGADTELEKERPQTAQDPLPAFTPTPHPTSEDETEAWLEAVMKDPDIARAIESNLAGTATDHIHKQADGTYTPARQQLHQAIVSSMLNPKAQAEPGVKPHVVILMGCPGAGKTTTLAPIAKEYGVEFTTVNADDVKAKLPEYNGSNAGLVHEESSDIAEGQLFPQAMQARHHLVMDITGANGKKVKAMVEQFHNHGYEISIAYAHLPAWKAATRVVDRFRKAGRFVPPTYVVNKVDGNPEETYNDLKNDPRVSHWRRYNNDVTKGTEAPLQEQGQRNRGESPNSSQGASLSKAVHRRAVQPHGRPTHGQDPAGLPDPIRKAYKLKASLTKSVIYLTDDLASPDLDPCSRGILLAERLRSIDQLQTLTDALTRIER